MSFRTNRRTRGIFRVDTSRLGVKRPSTRVIPAETKFFMDVARDAGLTTRIEIRNLDSLKSRGFPENESSELSDKRKDYIQKNINTIGYINVRGYNGDVMDGNHRWVAFKELGIKHAPVLAFYGSKDAFEKFELFIQDYNTTAGHHTIMPKKYGKLPHEK
jgi:hypothetical protein